MSENRDEKVATHPTRMAPILPIHRTAPNSALVTVTERVVGELRSYIEQNNLEPGHKLPPERVFLAELGVSRSSLREAVRVLSTLGLIEVRHGDGMYVSATRDAWRPSSGDIFDATEEHALRNLVETRLGIETAAVMVAAQRATDEEIARLDAFVAAQGRDLHDRKAWEPLAFELAVVEMTGNSWLWEVEIRLRDAWLSLSKGLRATVGRYEEWLAEHAAIAASIRARNPQQAQRLVAAHLSLDRFEADLRSPAKAAGRRTANQSTGRRSR